MDGSYLGKYIKYKTPLKYTGSFQKVPILLLEMRRSLNELNMGFAGELTMTDKMEDLMMALFLNRVPSSWTKLAWASERD